MNNITFALNHMSAPRLGVSDFFALAGSLGIDRVEIRNDLASNAILDGTPAAAIRASAEKAGLDIVSINALQRFNEWTQEREAEARFLIEYARECGARALVLVPVNDGSGRAEGERQANLRVALQALGPILRSNGVIGLVEPLGFQTCSLRSKREAVDAIDAVDGGDVFRIVHDTFHHVLAGEPDIFPVRTGLVHISGVTDNTVGVDDMRDPHRVLVRPGDRLDNIGQIRALRAAGYKGAFSFEPFAPSVHSAADPVPLIAESMEFIRTHA
jgi:2-keto-myo-inositol isomerase